MSPGESHEVIGLIPYLGPEFVTAILKRENISAVDLRADSKSVMETSPSTLRSQSRVNGRAGDDPPQHSMVRKTWHRLCSFWMEHIGGFS